MYIFIFQKENNSFIKRIKELEAENAKLKEEIEKLKESTNFLSEEQRSHSLIEKASIKNWSQEGIIQALKLRFALGKFGYEYLRSTGYPTPSYSTLNRRMKNFNMKFGILNSFRDYLKLKIDMLSENDKWCSVTVDEMEISKNKDFDTSEKRFVGGVSLGPEASGNHYTVVLLRGLKSKWKQVIAHEVTGPSTPGPDMRKLIDETLKTCKELGLKPKAVVSDMGGNNRAMWREFGVNVTRNTRNTVYNTEGGDSINCVADVPHLLKNLRSALLSRPLILPPDICEKEGLTCRMVSAGYIKQLWIKELDQKTSLRSLNHLSKEHLFPTHFNTMNVATAVQLFSIKTAAALEKAVRVKLLQPAALTTAWYIRFVHEWFEMMSARHVKKGITKRNKDTKLQFLDDFIYTTQNMEFGKGWKPLQTGIILSTLSVINLTNEALSEGFRYFLPGRLSQDALENVFSQIRRKAGRKPTALKARRALKLICVSQFISDLTDVNYFSDNDCHLFSMQNGQVTPTHSVNEVLMESDNTSSSLTCSDENEVYYIAGVTLNGILKKKLCPACIKAAENAVDSNEENIPEYLKYLTKYSDMGGLKYPASGFYRICREAECEVQHYKDAWVRDEISLSDGTISAVKERCTNVQMPVCCILKEKIIDYYLTVRCRGISKHMCDKSAYGVSYSSASLGKKR